MNDAISKAVLLLDEDQVQAAFEVLTAEVERLHAENTTMRATLDGIRTAVNAWRELDAPNDHSRDQER